MKTIFTFIVVSAGIFGVFNLKHANAVSDSTTPIVLELFTSQSCSSCPPADKLLGKLAEENKNIIALSCNVTYWNHLHWKDTLSKEFCTKRQHQYVQTLKSRGPYTPQIVINGRKTMVGSQAGKIKWAMQNEAKNNRINSIDLSLTDNNLKIRLPETPSNDSYALNLMVVGKSLTQDIPSGENKGRRVHYTNPVQKIISLGSWDGTGKTMNYDTSELTDNKSFVILAQKNGKTGEIIATGQINR